MLNFYKLEQQIEEQMKAARVPGLALAVVQNQEVIYARGFGVTSVEDGGAKVTPSTLFRIGSITKPLTGTAVMQLVESGKLDLDKPIKEYIDWFTLSEPGFADSLTLRMLMSHTSGLAADAKNFGSRDPDGLETYVREEIPRYPLIAPPGKLHLYSNPGISLVGYIAEVASGKPFTELMQHLVFEPLEMQRTTFDPTVAMTYSLAQSHNLNEDGTLNVEHRFADNVAHYPAGFAMSTVLDLANFAMMQMNQGCFRDKQVLSLQSVIEMQTVQADCYMTTGAGYGLTFLIEPYKEIRQVGHDGGISTFGSSLVMAPDAGVAVVMLFNRASDFFVTSLKFVNHIFDQLLNLPQETPKPQAVEPERSLWGLYVGSYLGPQLGLATILVMDDQLTLDLNGEVVPLKALKNDLYFGQKPETSEEITVGFIPEPAEPTQYIMVNTSPCQRIELDAALLPDPTAWGAYVGTYTADIDTLTVRISGDRLNIHSKWFNDEMLCMPLDSTRFVGKFGLAEFQVGDDGRVPLLKLCSSFTFTRTEEDCS